MRKGFDSLSAQAQTDPFSGHVFCFSRPARRRGELVKLLWWDGDGLCRCACSPSSWSAANSYDDGLRRAWWC